MLTIDQFRATRTECADLGAHIRDFGLGGIRGYVYTDDVYIAICDDGEFCLTIWNDSVKSADLADLERMLYTWCLMECPEDMGITRADVVELIDALCEGEAPRSTDTRADYEARIADYVNGILSDGTDGYELPNRAWARIRIASEKWAARFQPEED